MRINLSRRLWQRQYLSAEKINSSHSFCFYIVKDATELTAPPRYEVYTSGLGAQEFTPDGMRVYQDLFFRCLL